jgi:8-amino-7-oxononanoate synthase
MTFFQQRLEAFPRIADYRLAKAAGYWPYYKTVESASMPRFTIEGNEYINFGSNNYLSLSYHPEVIDAANRATQKYGTGVTGSRLLNGTLDLHRELEHELAEFFGREAALVFSTGYVANVSTISGLLHRHDYVVLDKDVHNSLLTGAQLSGATMKRFGHNDVARLAKILGELPPDAGKGVIVDGVYSMGGDTAPLRELVALCAEHPNTFLLDDEAHGLGVLGAHGRGGGGGNEGGGGGRSVRSTTVCSTTPISSRSRSRRRSARAAARSSDPPKPSSSSPSTPTR